MDKDRESELTEIINDISRVKNRLYEDNDSLMKENEKLKAENEYYILKYEKLKAENEKLKKDHRDWQEIYIRQNEMHRRLKNRVIYGSKFTKNEIDLLKEKGYIKS